MYFLRQVILGAFAMTVSKKKKTSATCSNCNGTLSRIQSDLRCITNIIITESRESIIVLRRHFGCWPLHDPFLKQVLSEDPSSVNPTPQLKITLWGWVGLEPKIQPLGGGLSKPQSCPEEKRMITNKYRIYKYITKK